MFTPGDKLEFGHYTILKEIGSGGMGVVYHCRDEFLQREIVIKMMLPEVMAEHDTVEHFRQEARLAARLEHPGIVTIHNIGVENRQGEVYHYIAMEYLPGGSLRARIEDKRISMEEALEWMKQLATALNYAHKQGVVHQDIKPDNIFITQDGNIKIGDFGLALIATGPAFERHAQGKGTPAYMSPELCRGEPRDHRSDIYSLGAVFFEILTGERPFKASGMVDMALKHATAAIPVASSLRPEVPKILDKIIKYMLAKQPTERLQSLGDILPTLEKLLLEMKVTRLGMTIPQSSPAQDSPPKAVNATASSVSSSNETINFNPRDASDARENVRGDAKEPLFKQAAVLEIEKERSLDLVWTFKSCGPIGWASTPVLNRTFKHIYLPSADGVFYSLDMNSGACLWYLDTGAPLVCSPLLLDDEIFCPSSNGKLYCLAAESGRVIWEYESDGPLVSTPTHVNEQLLITSLDGTLKSLSRSKGKVNWTYNCQKGISCSAQVSEDVVFVGGKDNTLHAVHLESGKQKWLCQTNEAILANVLVSTDSVYCGCKSGEILAADIDTGKRIWTYEASSPLLCKGNLEFSSLNYCTKDGAIHCLDKYKGTRIWTNQASGAVLGGITSAAGAIYAAARNGVLHAFNAKTGELRWHTQLTSALESAPLVTSTAIYQGTVDGELHAFSQRAGH